MNMLLFLPLAAAVCLYLYRPHSAARKIRQRLSAGNAPAPRFWSFRPFPADRRREKSQPVSLVVLVQQLAALLRGGRGPSQLWEELWLVHGAKRRVTEPAQSTLPSATALSKEALKVLAAARSASALGGSTAHAIRQASAQAYPERGNIERRIWSELAACLEVAEVSGCPLAGLLTRFAAQLEAEEDAEAARQTALAGPKATVRLLSWLPFFGLLLGMALGVDPFGILLGNAMGISALVVGLALTVAGRVWSYRLVASAVGVQ